MCYSAIVNAHTKKLQRRFPGTRVDVEAFATLYERRAIDTAIKIPKAIDANFYDPSTPAEERIRAAVGAYQVRVSGEWEAELFKQRKRLADAERKLQAKPTAAARESARIAADKIKSLTTRLSRLRSNEIRERDARIFPEHYAPIILMDAGELVIRPARYKCRPAGKPRNYDARYPGTYNARRDNLQGFWKNEFGATHAVVMVDSFFENVTLHDYERRELQPGEKETNLVLHFNPQPAAPMTIACIYSRWNDAAEDLLSFAIITDEPPPEIAVTGHDRCPVPLQEENVAAWLTPAGRPLAELDQLLEQRARPYYGHQRAA